MSFPVPMNGIQIKSTAFFGRMLIQKSLHRNDFVSGWLEFLFFDHMTSMLMACYHRRTTNARLAVTAVNPDVFGNAWSQNPRLVNITLLYRKAGTFIWSTASNADGPVIFPISIASVRLWNTNSSVVFETNFQLTWVSLKKRMRITPSIYVTTQRRLLLRFK